MADYREKRKVRVTRQNEDARAKDWERREAAAKQRAAERAKEMERREAAARQRAEERAREAQQREMNERLTRETDNIPMRERKSRSPETQYPREKRYVRRKPGERTYQDGRFTVVDGRKHINRRNRRILLALICLLVVGLCVFSLMTPVGVSEYISNQMAMWGGGDGYPLQLADDAVKAAVSQGKVTTAVGSLNYETFNKNGKQILFRQHGFLNPAIAQSESRFVLYDRGSTGYSVNNMEKVLYAGDLENKIYSAAVSRDGTVAFATSSVEYKSQLMVVDDKNVNVYNWYSAGADLSAVTVADNGKKIAAATMSATGGKFVSTLYIFDIKKDAPIFTLDLDDTIVVSMERVSSKTFLVLCNNQAFLYDWEGGQLYHYQPVGVMKLGKVNDEHLLFAESVTGNSGGSVITLVDKKAEEVNTFTVSETIKDIAYSKKAVYILSDHRITAYTQSGNVAAEIPCDFSVTDLVPYEDDGVLAVGFGEIAHIQAVSRTKLNEADHT